MEEKEKNSSLPSSSSSSVSPNATEDDPKPITIQTTADLGIYDSMGFDNPSLVQYLLEPQHSESVFGEEKKVKTSSEGYVVVYDVSNPTSFHLVSLHSFFFKKKFMAILIHFFIFLQGVTIYRSNF